jgi:catechol 2,3-dioxygenase-like lactoylglutathione lyase family enzyme
MRSIDIVSIPVSDQQAAKEFYGFLGFKTLEEIPLPNGHNWVRMGLEGSATTIALVKAYSRMTPGTLQGLILRTDDLLADRNKLVGLGVKVSEIEDGHTGKFCSLRDPDRNDLMLVER